MIGGAVTRVRELSRGVQADVSVGESEHGYATITVVTQRPEVMRALNDLKAALRLVAHDTIVGAQKREIRRGRTPIGVEPEAVAEERKAIEASA